LRPSGEPDAQALLHELRVHQLELEMQNEELRTARVDTEIALARYTELFDFAPVAYATINSGHEILNINHAGALLLGSARSTLCGRNFEALVELDHQASFRSLSLAAEESGIKQTAEVELRRERSRPFPVRLSVIALPRAETNLLVAFEDITERRQRQQQLEQTEQALREADRRKDEFLAVLAHELRNPLAPIRQAAKILRNENVTDAQRRWSNNVIERQVQHMSLLLDDLLEVSRITHGTLQLRKQQTDLHSIVSAAVETARPLIDERRHQFTIDVPAQLEVNADPLRLAQVLSNLLTNAAKYTDPHGRIRVGAAQSGDELVISVEDNGIGIAAEDLAKVFGMFAQLRGAQEHASGGLGIGLALAKGIVDLHGGRIEVASGGAGKGSRFTVRLPNLVTAMENKAVARVATSGHAAVSRRILLADDNRDAAESLAIILRLEGHEVELAHDGVAALRSFAEHKPDVALLDIGMPKANGLDVARQIRATPDGKGVLLIAITGWAQDSDKEQSRAAGFDHHLTKPIEPDTLIGLLGDS
jgi:PAS domain S-box-containing protein